MADIKRQFGIERLQYACVAEERGTQHDRPHVHVQIILKERVNKKTWFLDTITETHCNYQVTANDRAWNEYIKKGLNFIEFGTFKSTTARKHIHWPSTSSPSSSAASSSRTTPHIAAAAAAAAAAATPSAGTRLQTHAKREQNKNIAQRALHLARASVHNAMALIQETMPDKFLAHSSWYVPMTVVHLTCLITHLLILSFLLGISPRSTTFVWEHNAMLIATVSSTRNTCGPSPSTTVHRNCVRSSALYSHAHTLLFV